MRPRKISKDLLILAILTVITVFTWIGLEVWRTISAPSIPKIPPGQLAPLNPKLESQIIEDLAKQEVIKKEKIATESGERL